LKRPEFFRIFGFFHRLLIHNTIVNHFGIKINFFSCKLLTTISNYGKL
jgi:hypothetical protein